jgi:hypothetical protein
MPVGLVHRHSREAARIMTILLRRFLVVAALLFWQGGFLFYASVVVPVGQQLTSHREQGFLTQQVTDYLNLSGVVALLPLAWDGVVSSDPSLRRRLWRWAAWLGMALTLALLAWLHPHLDVLLDRSALSIADRPLFRDRHRAYLWISTVQWALAMMYAVLMLIAWRTEDRRPDAGASASGGRVEV